MICSFYPKTCRWCVCAAVIGFALVTMTSARAQDVNAAAEAGAATSPLASGQSQLANRFKKLESLLLRSAEVERASNPTRAELMQKAAALAKQVQLSDALVRAARSLEQKQYSQAIDDQKASLDNLNKILELLQSENRGDRLRGQRDQVKRTIEETERLLRLQSSLRGRTEGGSQTEKAASDQQKLADKAGQIADDLSPDSKDSKESKDSKNPPDSQKSTGKDSNEKDSNKDSDNNSSEKKPGDKNKGDSKNSDDKNAEDKNAGDKKGDDKKADDKKADDKKADDKKADEDKSDKPADGQAKDKQGDKPSDSPSGDGEKSKDNPSDNQKSSPSPSPKDQESQPGENSPPQPGENQQSPQQSEQSEQSQQPKKQQSPTDRAAEKLKRAQQQMKEAQKNLEEANRSGAVEKQRQAEQELKTAIEELEEILRQLREEEIERSLTALEERLRLMLQLQNKVLDESKRLQEIGAGANDRQVEIRSNNLSNDEKKIINEAQRALLLLREEGTSAAFPESLSHIISDMQKVVERLAKADVGKLTIGIEEDIVASLEELVAAMSEIKKENKERKENQMQAPGQQGQPGEQPLVNQLAEMRLIKTLQIRINKRTQTLAEVLKDPSDAVGQAEAEDIQGQLRELAERQSSIKQVTRDIVIGKNQQ